MRFRLAVVFAAIFISTPSKGLAADISPFVVNNSSPVCGAGERKPFIVGACDIDRSKSCSELVTLMHLFEYPRCEHIVHGWYPMPQVDEKTAARPDMRLLATFFTSLGKLRSEALPGFQGLPLDYLPSSGCEGVKDAIDRYWSLFFEIQRVAPNWVRCLEQADEARNTQFVGNQRVRERIALQRFLVAADVSNAEASALLSGVVLMIEDAPPKTKTLADVLAELGLRTDP